MKDEETLDMLLKKAQKHLNENIGVNEVAINVGRLQVHLIRFTPIPQTWTWPYNYQGIIPQQG